MFTPPQWMGLNNYVKMFAEDGRYYQSLRVTFTLCFPFRSVETGLRAGIAMLLNRGLKGLGFYRSVYYLPSLLGGSVAVAIMWRQVFAYDGVINQVLLKVRHRWPELDHQHGLCALYAGRARGVAVRLSDGYLSGRP